MPGDNQEPTTTKNWSLLTPGSRAQKWQRWQIYTSKDWRNYPVERLEMYMQLQTPTRSCLLQRIESLLMMWYSRMCEECFPLLHLTYYSILQGIPRKGEILTLMSLFWFDKLKDVIPNHLITANIDEMPPDVQVHADVLKGRSMLVRKAKVVPLEAIVRGYLSGEKDLIYLQWN